MSVAFNPSVWQCGGLTSLQTDEQFPLLVDSVKDYAIFVLNPAGYIVTWNQGAQRIKGYTADEIVGENFARFYSFEDIRNGKPQQHLRDAISHGRLEDEGWRFRKDGSRFWASVVITPLKDAVGHLRGFAKVTRDISERKLAEDALRRSEEKYRYFFDSCRAAAFTADSNGDILSCNSTFAGMLGFPSVEDLIGQNLASLCSEPGFYLELVRVLKAEGKLYRSGLELQRNDGGQMYAALSATGTFDERAQLERILGYFVDETEQRKSEEQVRQDLKMQALGRLAGGIAHDFNNVLSVTQGFAEIMRDKLSPDDPLQKYLEQILESSRRGSGLTRHLLAFSRQQVLKPSIVNLNMIVAGLAKLLPRLLGTDNELITTLAPDLGQIEGDLNQIEQIILNLATNARDAMPGGGRLRLETKNIKHTGSAQYPVMPSGRYVVLTVTDTGVGIPEDLSKRIFDPFFTTKGPGKGTGLGLSIVYGIVKQNHGFIWVSSKPGEGSSFKVYFPQVLERVRVPNPEQSPFEDTGGNETILIAEDEVALRGVEEEYLRNLGYNLLIAKDGLEALEMAKRHAGPIDLLITDVIMPLMSGPELAEQLTPIQGGIPVIYVSGYTNQEVVDRTGLLESELHFLQKPFSLHELSRQIRALLDSELDVSSGAA